MMFFRTGSTSAVICAIIGFTVTALGYQKHRRNQWTSSFVMIAKDNNKELNKKSFIVCVSKHMMKASRSTFQSSRILII